MCVRCDTHIHLWSLPRTNPNSWTVHLMGTYRKNKTSEGRVQDIRGWNSLWMFCRGKSIHTLNQNRKWLITLWRYNKREFSVLPSAFFPRMNLTSHPMLKRKSILLGQAPSLSPACVLEFHGRPSSGRSSLHWFCYAVGGFCIPPFRIISVRYLQNSWLPFSSTALESTLLLSEEWISFQASLCCSNSFTCDRRFCLPTLPRS